MSRQSSVLFTQLMERLISQRLQKHVGSGVSPDALYADVKHIVDDVFLRCEFSFVDKTREFVASGYFAMLNINGQESLFKDHENARRVRASELPTSDLLMLRQLFVEHPLEDVVAVELRKRQN